MKKAVVSKGASKKKVGVITHVIEPNAAGIDVGSTEMFVAVPVDRDEQPVRCFTTFTRDLVGLADWLKQCGAKFHVAPSEPPLHPRCRCCCRPQTSTNLDATHY